MLVLPVSPRVPLLAGLLDATGHLRPVRFLRGVPSYDHKYSVSHSDLWSPGNFVDISIMLLLVPDCQIGARNPLG